MTSHTHLLRNGASLVAAALMAATLALGATVAAQTSADHSASIDPASGANHQPVVLARRCNSCMP